ncbi:MAG: type II toxin-antitoxin system PemK/MazF family toxin [Cytophagaceae bacterium]
MPFNRGDICFVNLDPTVGAEMQKKRRCVIVSSDAIGILPIKIIAPITEWNPAFENNSWHVKVLPNVKNGLTKVSAIDALQMRCVDIRRFGSKVGELDLETMKELTQAIALVIEI